MKKLLNIVTLIFLALSILACGEDINSPSENNSKVVYFNTFENPSDFNFFSGSCKLDTLNNPSNIGKRSLLVYNESASMSAFKAHEILEEGFYTIGFWSKVNQDDVVGNVSFSTSLVNSSENVSLMINDKNWSYYESESSIYVSTNDTIYFHFFVSGKDINSMNVDDLKIIKIN